MNPEILFLIKQVRPRASQIDDLRTPVPVLFQPCTFKAVKRIADPFATAHDTLVLIIAEGALVADAREGGGSHVGVADGTFAVTFVAQAADFDARHFAAHDQVRVVAGHCGEELTM